MEGARLPLNGGRPSPEETRTPPERDRPPAAATVRTPFGAPPIALEGVDPTGSRTPVGQELNRDAETRMRIEREFFGRVPPNAMAPSFNGLRASPSLGGIGSTPSFGGRRSFRPLGGIGAEPSSGKGPQTPSGARSTKGKVELKIDGYPNAGQAVAPDLEISRHSAKARSREARRKFAVADSG